MSKFGGKSADKWRGFVAKSPHDRNEKRVMTANVKIQHLPNPSMQVWLTAAFFSAVAHFVAVGGIGPGQKATKPADTKIAIRVHDMPAPKVEPELIKPKPKPEKKEKPKPTPNQTVQKTTQVDTPPVQGLTKDSVSDKGTMSAPVGNTMMTEDVGKRVKDAAPITGDLSAPATLVRESVTIPPYSEQALDASLEGTWVVDVFVNADGSIKDAELRKKIGYGMDEKVLAAAKAAKFVPRKNRLGVAEPGWAEIKFTLVIP